MKWNESDFRPPLCTYRLNWARRTSWGRWDDWDDTVLQTQDSKFEPWRSEAEHATSRSRRLPTILTFTRGWGRNIFVSFKPPRPGTEPRTLAWKAAVLTTTLGPPLISRWGQHAGHTTVLRRWINVNHTTLLRRWSNVKDTASSWRWINVNDTTLLRPWINVNDVSDSTSQQKRVPRGKENLLPWATLNRSNHRVKCPRENY